ncbi:hypothetical protein TNCV_1346101 [Trichonephila clavipes]|nr:hypothetical protein TNCV_1346101 [Trichonephila clavipes]
MFQILFWSPWKYRYGQRTVRMAVVACSQKQRSLRAQAHLSKSRTETCELVKVKQKLLEMRAELERKREAAKENAREWNVRKVFITSFNLDRKPQAVGNGAMIGEHGHQIGRTMCLLLNPASACNITMVRFEFRDTLVRG